MSWAIVDWMQNGLPEVETSVNFEREGAINLAAGLFVAGFLILLTWYVIKKKL